MKMSQVLASISAHLDKKHLGTFDSHDSFCLLATFSRNGFGCVSLVQSIHLHCGT